MGTLHYGALFLLYIPSLLLKKDEVYELGFHFRVPLLQLFGPYRDSDMVYCFYSESVLDERLVCGLLFMV